MTQTSAQTPTARRISVRAQLLCFGLAVLLGGFGQAYLLHRIVEAAASNSAAAPGPTGARASSAPVELSGAVVRLAAD